MTGAVSIQRALADVNTQQGAWQIESPQEVVTTVIHSFNTIAMTS